MLGRTYDDQVCSVARTLELVGDRWTLLVVRDIMLGVERFDDLQRRLGVARNVLSDRLTRLTDSGVVDRVRYLRRPPRYEYRLTSKGQQLAIPIIGLMDWGDRHLAGPEGPPRLSRHRGCGGSVHAQLQCTRCDRPVTPDQAEVVDGPGMPRTSDQEPRSRLSGVEA